MTAPKKPATKKWRVYLSNGTSHLVTADRYELDHDEWGYGYILFLVGDEEIGFFPVKDLLGVIPGVARG